MASVIGQQVMALASSTFKMATSVLATHESPSPWWSHTAENSMGLHKTYTLEEVSWHWEPNDCWMIINDKVYDLTDFLSEHPGGYDVLLEYAGRDATLAFLSVGHSKQSMVTMEKYCIGVLVNEQRIYTKD